MTTTAPPLIYAANEGSVPIHDASHLRNHLYYLFSRTKAHPETADTKRNLILEFESDASGNPKRLRSFYNSNSKEACQRAQACMPTKSRDMAGLRSDVTYFAFMIPFDGVWVSNFVQGDLAAARPEVSIDTGTLGCVANNLPSQAVVQREISARLNGAHHLVDYAAIKSEIRQKVDVALMKAARDIVSVRPLVMAFHNDQSPAPCHLHRLYRP